MKAKKVIALVMCAAMVAGMSASSVMAADMPEQFKDLKANEAYDFPMMVNLSSLHTGMQLRKV